MLDLGQLRDQFLVHRPQRGDLRRLPPDEAEQTLALHPSGSGTEDHTMTGPPTRDRHAASCELNSTRGLRHAPHCGLRCLADPPASLPVRIVHEQLEQASPFQFSRSAGLPRICAARRAQRSLGAEGQILVSGLARAP